MQRMYILPAALALGFVTAGPALAQSDAETVRELRRQMQQLQRRLDALEARQRQLVPAAAAAPAPNAATPQPQAGIRPLPQQATPLPPARPGTPPGTANATAAAPANAGPVPSQGSQQPPEQAATLGTLPGFIGVPGSNTAVRLYGFAVGIMTRDGGPRNRSDAVTAQGIPLSPSAASRQGGELLFSGRRSRLGLETVSDTDWGRLRTVLEMDFAGSQSTASLQSQASTNSYIPRLRLAYGELGPFLAGQNWSLFYDENYPQRLDYATPFATSNVRQAQFRYTHSFGHGLSLAGSVEQPYTDLTSSGGVRYADVDTGTAPPLTIDRTPDFLARLHWQDEKVGSVALTGLLRPSMELTNVGDTNPALRYHQSTTGWGFQVAAMARLFERDRAFLRFVYGQGVGRYLDSTANGQGAVTNAGLTGIGTTQVRINEVPMVAALLG